MVRFSMHRVVPLLSAICLAVVAPAAAQKKGGDPAPVQNYVCPHSDDKSAVDCYCDAVPHLYTMCKHVKSIEIIEFGYEHATEGTHGAKSEYCIAKQTQNIAKPYQGALREAEISQQATEAMKGLQDYWLRSTPVNPPARPDDRTRLAPRRVRCRLQDAHSGSLRKVQGTHRRHQGNPDSREITHD